MGKSRKQRKSIKNLEFKKTVQENLVSQIDRFKNLKKKKPISKRKEKIIRNNKIKEKIKKITSPNNSENKSELEKKIISENSEDEIEEEKIDNCILLELKNPKDKKITYTEQEKLNRRYEKIIFNLELSYQKTKEKFENAENLTNFLLIKMEKRITEILKNWKNYSDNLKNKKKTIFEKTKETFIFRLKNDFRENNKNLKFLINPDFEEDKKKDKRGRKKKSEEENFEILKNDLVKNNYISESRYRYRNRKHTNSHFDEVDMELLRYQNLDQQQGEMLNNLLNE